MIVGRVSAKREPAVPLRVYGMAGAYIDLTATVDTGFTGALTLPPADVAALGLPLKGHKPYTLADGSRIIADLFVGLVDWHGRPSAVYVEAADCEPLLGMELLADSELWLEGRPGGAVEISPALPPPAPAP